MLETSAYFEAYRHVLKALQGMHEADIPFRENIVRCRKVDNPPRYLIAAAEPMYDLRPLAREPRKRRREEEDGDEDDEDEYHVSRIYCKFLIMFLSVEVRKGTFYT